MKGRESTYGGWVRSSTVKTVAENNGRSEVPVVVKENNKKKKNNNTISFFVLQKDRNLLRMLKLEYRRTKVDARCDNHRDHDGVVPGCKENARAIIDNDEYR